MTSPTRSTWWSVPIGATCARSPATPPRGRLPSPIRHRRVAWRGRRRSATHASTPRSATSCESAVRRLEAAGTEVIELDTVFDEDPSPSISALGVDVHATDHRALPRHADVVAARPVRRVGGRDLCRHHHRRRPRRGRGRVPPAQRQAGRRPRRRRPAAVPHDVRRDAARVHAGDRRRAARTLHDGRRHRRRAR